MTAGPKTPLPPQLVEFVRRMPKAEIHVHLEGSIRPATLLALAARHGAELPAQDEPGLARWFQFRDFEHFVQIYFTCSGLLREPEDFRRVALDYLEEQARQNVLYSEAHFTISTHVAMGRDGAEVMDALEDAAREGERRWGVRVGWIPDIVRNMGFDRADVTIDWALAGKERGVVALGLAGIEAGYPASPFAEYFEAARGGGIHTVAHAGEHGGPDSVREALAMGAERIGHGVRSVDDPGLVDELAASAVPIEVSPTSNLCLGVAPDLAAHPFDRLYRAGCNVSINSDDPPLFATTLTDEYLDLAATFGYGADELAGFALAALDATFLEEAEKVALRQRFEEELASLRSELFEADGTG